MHHFAPFPALEERTRMADEQQVHAGSGGDTQCDWLHASCDWYDQRLYATAQRLQRAQCIDLALFQPIDDNPPRVEAGGDFKEPLPSLRVIGVAWLCPVRAHDSKGEIVIRNTTQEVWSFWEVGFGS